MEITVNQGRSEFWKYFKRAGGSNLKKFSSWDFQTYKKTIPEDRGEGKMKKDSSSRTMNSGRRGEKG